MLYKMIRNPQEGDEVQFLGVYATRWPWESGVEPTVAFIETSENTRLDDLYNQLQAAGCNHSACDGGDHSIRCPLGVAARIAGLED